MLRIAAVVLVTIGLYFTIFSNTDKTVKTLAGEQSEIVLPDNSQVVVNAQSMLSYSAKRWKDNRVVDLNGEAYFKVAKGTTFDVNTPSGQVTVMGTQFNVKQRHDYFEVTCYEGSVKVSSNNRVELLKQGDVYRMIAGEYLQIKTTSKAPQWTQAISSFAKVPLAEVLAELERQYGVEVAPNGIDLDRLFTGGFTHQNLDEALTAITQPMGLEYTVESDKRVKVYAQ